MPSRWTAGRPRSSTVWTVTRGMSSGSRCPCSGRCWPDWTSPSPTSGSATGVTDRRVVPPAPGPSWRRPPPALPPLKLGDGGRRPPGGAGTDGRGHQVAFRRLCRTFGAGLYVSEMITARALVEGNAKTLGMAAFGDDEPVPQRPAVRRRPRGDRCGGARLVGEIGVDHVDLNFGCPAGQGHPAGRRRGPAGAPRASSRPSSALPSTPPARCRSPSSSGSASTTTTTPTSRPGRIAEDRGCGRRHPARPHRRAALLG